MIASTLGDWIMYLHLGEDISVPLKTIIGIFDLECCNNSIASKEFLELARSEKKYNSIGNEKKNKSFIITNEGIYLSPISTITLLKRTNDIFKEFI